jgi:proline iminopeptidase
VGVVSVNGTELFFERDGVGPGCLVLHGGLGVDHVMYRRSLAVLSETHDVVWLDQRGNGRSGRPPSSTITIEQLADDAAEVIERLDLVAPVVIGHSYGGFVAQELALRHPASVGMLALVATTPGQLGTNEDPDDGRGAPLPDEAAELLAVTPVDDVGLADGLRRLLPWYLHRRDVSDVVAMLDGTVFSRDAMVRGFEVLASWSSVDRLHRIDAPTLVAVGAHDVFTSPPQARRIASRIAGSQLVEFADSGHFPWLDEPVRFFGAIDEWLATH